MELGLDSCVQYLRGFHVFHVHARPTFPQWSMLHLIQMQKSAHTAATPEVIPRTTIIPQYAKLKSMRLYRQDANRRRCSPGWMTKRSTTSWWGARLAVVVVVLWQLVFLSSVAMAANSRRPPQHNQSTKKDAEDYYKILGLKRNCKPKEIKVMLVLLC